ncbi:hypothetical protein FOS14_22295 [Skermania sp. ID1734]|uniref:hypothetical protein n=1 Tax=Skermania sp. ID1734 TaxID=2597516 RepID=UPI00117D3B1D|nr:hypothetical protein [Skermania sp. ID1734]TSD93791.1 hypothetical protein FOS14_22295 [Skermania sp. ID1734]
MRRDNSTTRRRILLVATSLAVTLAPAIAVVTPAVADTVPGVVQVDRGNYDVPGQGSHGDDVNRTKHHRHHSRPNTNFNNQFQNQRGPLGSLNSGVIPRLGSS